MRSKLLPICGAALLFAGGVAYAPSGTPDFSGFRQECDLALKVLRALPEENRAAFSPLGAELNLAGLYAGSSHATRDEFAELLGEHSSDAFLKKMRNQWKRVVTQSDGVQVSCENSLRLDTTWTKPNPLWVNALKKDGLFKVNTQSNRSPAQTAKSLNEEAAKVTDGVIASPVSEEDLTSHIKGVSHYFTLMNVITFEGEWETAFEDTLGKIPFFPGGNRAEMLIPMMIQYDIELAATKDERWTSFTLPFRNKNYALTVVMPAEPLEPAALLRALSVDALTDHPQKQSGTRVRLTMPEFEIRTAVDLKGAFYNLGVHEWESFENALVKTVYRQHVRVDSFTQKNRVEITKTGAKARSVTTSHGFSIGCSMPERPLPPEVTITVDRPFFYFIRCSTPEGGVILFTGIYSCAD